ncbi:S8 family serine peptidase [Gemmatimonas sp.]|uniref:S8 family peptidase n=1 Tax=Gemmatimonas sp. TaxID=1962908 RepID=UPI00286E6F85|nr:S8 family serine peptidase [Gemmatimonas sp.]
MSKMFARRSAVALSTLLVIGCSSDNPAVESIAGADLQAPRLSSSQLEDPNGVIVTVTAMGADGSVPLNILEELQRQGAQVSYVDPYSKVAVVQGLRDEIAIRGLESVKEVLPNLGFTLHTDQSGASFYATQQQNLPLIRATNAWATSFSGAGTNVCIIDSGVDDTHPDLVGRVSKAISFLDVGDGAANADGNGHGTHVGSTVSSNGLGIASVASDATLMNARVFNAAGGGATTARILSAIRWCGREGAHVINMSLGFGNGLSLTDPTVALFKAAIDEVRLGTDVVNSGPGGVVVVASAGNSNLRFPSQYAMPVPGGIDGVIMVGATARGSNTRAIYSNRGRSVDLWAPGSNILAVCSTFTTNCLGGTIRQRTGVVGNPGRYMEISGTSMAAPHVAAVAAIAYGRLGTTRTSTQGARIEACMLTKARVTGQVQILPDPAGSRVDALLAATSPDC